MLDLIHRCLCLFIVSKIWIAHKFQGSRHKTNTDFRLSLPTKPQTALRICSIIKHANIAFLDFLVCQYPFTQDNVSVILKLAGMAVLDK